MEPFSPQDVYEWATGLLGTDKNSIARLGATSLIVFLIGSVVLSYWAKGRQYLPETVAVRKSLAAGGIGFVRLVFVLSVAALAAYYAYTNWVIFLDGRNWDQVEADEDILRFWGVVGLCLGAIALLGLIANWAFDKVLSKIPNSKDNMFFALLSAVAWSFAILVLLQVEILQPYSTALFIIALFALLAWLAYVIYRTGKQIGYANILRVVAYAVLAVVALWMVISVLSWAWGFFSYLVVGALAAALAVYLIKRQDTATTSP